MTEYLYVRNWRRFQHYGLRSPPWVKLHRRVLASEDWVMLADASRLLMLVCMMVASEHDGRVPNNPAYIKRVAHLNRLPNLNPLIECGFLSRTLAPASTMLADASTMLAPASALQAAATTERDTEKKDTPERESTSQPFAGFAKKPAAGRKANGQAGQAAGSRYPAWFEAIWAAYRPIASPNSSKSRALTAAKRLSEADREDCRAGLAGYVAWLRKARGKRADFPAQHLATFINGRGWEAFSEQQSGAPPPVSDAEMQRIVDTINAEREREETDDLAH